MSPSEFVCSGTVVMGQILYKCMIVILNVKLIGAIPINPNVPEELLCLSEHCEAGYKMIKVNGDCPDGMIQCSPCEDGTFTAYLNQLKQCFPHRACTPVEIEIQAGTKTSDTVCQCKHGRYRSASGVCQRWTKCGEGYGVLTLGNASHNVVCHKCLNGTFSDIEDSLSPCKSQTRCEDLGKKTLTPGTPESDSICQPQSENDALTTGQASTKFVPSKEEITPSHSVVENSTEVNGQDVENSSDNSSQHSNTLIIIIVIVVLVFVGIAIIVIRLYNKRRGQTTQTQANVASHGMSDTTQLNGHAVTNNQGQDRNPQQNGGPGTVNVTNQIEINIMSNGTISHTPGTGEDACGGESRPGSNSKTNANDDEEEEKTAVGIEETSKLITDENSESHCDQQPIVQCTDDPKDNVNDIQEKEVNDAVSEIPLDEDREGNSNESDSDDVDTKRLEV